MHPHCGVLPATTTLTVLSWNPAAVSCRLYAPGMPGTTQDVADAPPVHWPEPEAAPDKVKVRPGTGPPAADVALTTMATGRGQVGMRQSGWVW